MALISTNNICNETTPANNAITLTAKSDESLMIRNITVSANTATYVNIYLNESLAGIYRVGGALGNQLFSANKNAPQGQNQNLLQFLSKRGIFAGFPVQAGNRLTLKGNGTINGASIIYDIYEQNDIKDEMQNGVSNKEAIQVIYDS